MIPFKYNLRNLWARRVTTGMTVLGTGAVVWCSCLLFGLADGLRHSLQVSGDPLDLIVIRKGSTNETTGGFDSAKADTVATLSGIARDEAGRPLVASELLNIPVIERVDGTRANLIIRGVQPTSRSLRPGFEIVEGRDFQPSSGECIVSRKLAGRFQGASLGGVIRAGDREQYRVVGIFAAGGGTAESEIWCDLPDLSRNTGREGSVSSVQLRAVSPEAMASLQKSLNDDPQFKLMAIPEPEYYAQQQNSMLFLQVFGTIIALFLTVGAMFAAANTMYAAVSSRTREIGTMRALGFSKFSVLVSFLGESVVLCLLGGALGLLAALPLGALTFGTFNSDTFSESTVNFRLGAGVMIVAVAMTAAMGIFGGLFPALRAVRLDVISALREL